MIKNKVRLFPMICGFNKTIANKFDISDLFLKKDFIQEVVSEFEETGLYSEKFLLDLEDGLRKSSYSEQYENKTP